MAVLRTSLADVLADYLLPLALGLQDVLNRVAQSAVASCVGRNIVSLFPNLIARIGDGNGKSTVSHDRKINHVVSDISGFVRTEALLANYFFENRQLILNTLMHVIQLQVASAQSDGF
jgi:hypothetical protein